MEGGTFYGRIKTTDLLISRIFGREMLLSYNGINVVFPMLLVNGLLACCRICIKSCYNSVDAIKPITLRMAVPLWSFGYSECNRVKGKNSSKNFHFIVSTGCELRLVG